MSSAIRPLGESNGQLSAAAGGPSSEKDVQGASVRVQLPVAGGVPEEAAVCRSGGISAVMDRVAQAFSGGIGGEAFVLSDLARDITTDEDLLGVKPTDALVIMFPGRGRALAAPAQETIKFPPHPKTLTMAGDYEYFAAAGNHPFPYALAELIDNALRAVKGNFGRAKHITVSLVTSPGEKDGMICVQDNGVGMTKRELNEWAVMNLSMEDRGLRPSEPPANDRATQMAPQVGSGIRRFLTSDLSYFGVGSKNAAFFLGRAIRVSTRHRGEAYCHEVRIAADELEERYKRNPDTVYEDTMYHRNPGDASTLTREEAAFTASQGWIQAEAQEGEESFTRILISQVRSDIMDILRSEGQGEVVCRHLAHLYHYYLHGEAGNRGGEGGGNPEAAAGLPCITVERIMGEKVAWRRDLAGVEDDLETRYLRAQRAELSFQLDVKDHGVVEALLWYFPFEYDSETVPGAEGPAGPDDDDEMDVTCTQLPTQAPLDDPRESGASEAPTLEGLRDAPIFESFWQGRLIPETMVGSVPFVEKVRAKRGAKGHDELPDAVFSRLRGALFFGPSFRVTRNKLSFRDNLPALLEGAVPSERNMERRFREWLCKCHTKLDKCVRFEGMAPPREQAEARKAGGERITLFERVVEGARVVRQGDLVRLQTKPVALGRVVHFVVHRAVKEEGSYSSGSVVIRPLPEDIYGDSARQSAPLRRMEGPLEEGEVAAHEARERARAPASLAVEPLSLAVSSAVLDVEAGGAIPASTVTVQDGTGSKITRAKIFGERKSLSVVQRLIFLGPPGTEPPPAGGAAAGGAAAEVEEEERERRGKRSAGGGGGGGKKRKGAKGRARAEPEAEAEEEAGAGLAALGAAAPPPAGEVVFVCKQAAPKKDTFAFAALEGGGGGGGLKALLGRAGEYVLEYALDPQPHAGAVLSRCRVRVSPGPAARVAVLDLPPEGVDLRLGQALRHSPSLAITDEYGNTVADVGHLADSVSLEVRARGEAGEAEVEASCHCSGLLDEDGPGRIRLRSLRLKGCAPAGGESGGGEGGGAGDGGGMRIFGASAPGRSRAAQERRGGAGAGAASVEVSLVVHVRGIGAGGGGEAGGEGEGAHAVVPVTLRPGLPHRLVMQPGHPFTPAAPDQEEAGGEGGEGAVPEAGGGLSLCESRITHGQKRSGADLLGEIPLESGQELPAFTVGVLDRWGNPTAPLVAPPPAGGSPTQATAPLTTVPDSQQVPADASFVVRAQCALMDPPREDFSVSAAGAAEVAGLVARAAAGGGRPDRLLTLSLVYDGIEGGGLGGASLPFAAAGGGDGDGEGPEDCNSKLGVAAVPPLRCRVSVRAGTSPARIVLLADGLPLPCEGAGGGGSDPEEPTYSAGGVAAGSALKLQLQLLDESGAPATTGLAGRLQLSWAKGSRGLTVESLVDLPSLPVTQSVGEPQAAWVRFKGEGGGVLEASLEVAPEAGPPASWSLLLLDDGGTQGPSLATRGGVDVVCGRPFTLEIEPADQYGNKCKVTGDDVASLPTPTVFPEGGEDAELRFCREEWEGAWRESSGPTEGTENLPSGVYVLKLVLLGTPGPVRLVARDEGGGAGAGGGAASLLAEDALVLDMLPGPPSRLVVLEPAGPRASCSTRGVLPHLVVAAQDAGGNLTPAAEFDVSLQPSALPSEGASGAACALAAVDGSNKRKLEGGKVTFDGIKVSAQSEGVYELRVHCASRKFSVLPAHLMLHLTKGNRVAGVAVVPESVEGGVEAGQCGLVVVEVETEDGRAIPEDAAEGLTVVMKRLDRGGGKKKKSKEMFRLASPLPVEGAPLQWAFRTMEVREVGEWSVTAEYEEARPAVLPTLAKNEAKKRSPAEKLRVAAGPPAALALDGGDADVVTVSNAGDERALTLLGCAAVRLVDTWGNYSEVEDVEVEAAVRWAAGVGGEEEAPPPPPEGAALPTLLCFPAEGAEPQPVPCALFTDAGGAAAFGRVAVQPGTGRGGGAAGGVSMELVFRARAAGMDTHGEGGIAELVVPALFEDNEARFAELQGLSARRSSLARRRHELAATVADARDAARDAREEVRAAEAAVARRLEELARAGAEGAPSSLEEAEAARAQVEASLRGGGGGEGGGPRRAARMGRGSKYKECATLRQLCEWKDPSVVGIVGHMATVDDDDVARVLSLVLTRRLTTIVLDSHESIPGLQGRFRAEKLFSPDILALDLVRTQHREAPKDKRCHAAPHEAGGGGERPQWVRHFHELHRAAQEGSDPPIHFTMPHSHLPLRDLPEELKQGCPRGFLGYAANLVRPTVPGTRASVWANLLGSFIIFDTLDNGMEYRRLMNKLGTRGNIPTILTLDFKRVVNTGIVSGDTWHVPPLEKMDFHFGSTPPRGNTAAQHAQHGALDGLVEAFRALGAAKEREGDAAGGEAAAGGAERELQEVEAELAGLDEQIGGPPSQDPGRSGGRKRGGRSAGGGEGEEGRPLGPGKRRRRGGE